MSRFAMGAVLAVAIAGAAHAQTQAPVPSFRAGVELVRLDIQVTDADGRPVRDLQQQDVEVVEAGVPRPVVFFQHVEEPAESFADTARHTIAGEVSTNQGAPRGHLYVLIFDQQHILPGREERAVRAAERFLRTKIRRGDRVAAYALPGPGIQAGFTADVRHLAAQIATVRGLAELQQQSPLGAMSLQEAYQIAGGDELTMRSVADRLKVTSPTTDTAGRTRQQESDQMFTATVREDARTIANRADGETRRMLAMFADILRPMAAIEGRKTVLFFSEGFYGDRVQREIEQVAAAAAESYSVVHAIDLSARVDDVTRDTPTPLEITRNVHDAMTPLGSLAAETSGQLLLDANPRVDQVLDTIADQSEDYYLIGFTPRETADKSRDAYHRVEVRVGRRGVRVSARTGFTFASDAHRLSRRDAIDRAMKSPFPLQALPLRYTTYTLRSTTPGLQRVIVSLAADLPLESPTQNAPADVAFVVRSTADGHIAASGADVIPLPHTRDQSATTGVGTYHVQFEVPAGEYLMRVAAREPGGLVGTADRRFTVAALDGPALTSGDLVLSAQRGDLPVRPTAYTGDGLSGVVELYGRTADQLRSARVEVDLTPVGENAALVTGAAELADVRAVSGGVARTARIELPLAGVAAGTYVARARVKVGPDTVSEAVREVDIRAGQQPAIVDETESAPLDPRLVVRGEVARRFTSQTSRTEPGGADALDGLARLGNGDFAGAVAALERSLQANPKSAIAAFFLGWAYHGAGQDREAVTAWRRAAYIDPTLVPAHLALADLYVRLAQPALAIQALRAGLTALPQSPELLDRLSRLERR